MYILSFILSIGLFALLMWVGYLISKLAIKNALNESAMGQYFKNKRSDNGNVDYSIK